MSLGYLGESTDASVGDLRKRNTNGQSRSMKQAAKNKWYRLLGAAIAMTTNLGYMEVLRKKTLYTTMRAMDHDNGAVTLSSEAVWV